MKLYSSEWEKITSDETILQAISGYKLEFENGPPEQGNLPFPYRLTENERNAVDLEIEKLITKGVISESQYEKGQFVSNVFTRNKKDGGHRMILDLSILNEYITYHHFKMDTFETARSLITPNCYMASIDLRDAYYSVPICESDRKYLKFFWKDKLYHYNSLPNGLSSGPRLFTKILKPPFAKLRSVGHVLTGYIDDSLFVGESKQQTKLAVEESAKFLDQLGFIIHPDKSIFKPTQEIEYLGFIINSNQMKVFLPQAKKKEIKEICNNLLMQEKSTIKIVSTVIGKMVAAFPAVQYGILNYRALEKDKIEALKRNCGHYDRSMSISRMAKEDLQWWIANIDNSYSCIYRGTPDMEISSDASGLGWGATNGTTHIGGRWNVDEASIAANNEINYLELLAAFLALKSFCKECRNIHVKISLDNTTAVAYISHMGGVKSVACNRLAKELWTWCIARSIWLTATHLPGVQNVIADRKSRVFEDETEWMLDKNIFSASCDFMKFDPDIDLFASRLNTQLKRYISWKPDPGAEAVDALSIYWGDVDFYAFPPFCLIGKCIQKIIQDEAEGIVIVPKWPTQAWFSKLLNMLVQDPVLLPKSKTLLIQPATGVTHPLIAKLELLACRLSGDPSRIQEYQMQLPELSCLHGVNQQRLSTMDTLLGGSNFAVQGKLIRCRQLPPMW